VLFSVGFLNRALQHADIFSQSGFLDKPQGKGFAFAGKPVEDDTILGSGIGFGPRLLADADVNAREEFRRQFSHGAVGLDFGDGRIQRHGRWPS
jgi:hypothetical protein